MLSVIMITYGHEKFIAKAIEGVLMQEVNFDIELIIADDCSPDNTQKVVEGILKHHPKSHLVKYTKHSSNKGMQPNFVWASKRCEGTYIALCEGDDYWTDPLKLQKQVDFLQQNSDYSICFHSVKIQYENNLKPFLLDINRDTEETTNLSDLLKGNYIHTPSVVFKNHKDLPDWFETAYPGDWPLHIISATYGKTKFLKADMAVYRVHGGGIHSTTGGNIERYFETFKNVLGELKKKRLYSEFQIGKKIYEKSFALQYGFGRTENIHFSRLRKSYLILKNADLKVKLFFWLPLLFNNSSQSVFKAILKVIGK